MAYTLKDSDLTTSWDSSSSWLSKNKKDVARQFKIETSGEVSESESSEVDFETEYDIIDSDPLLKNNLTGIHGMPYQFLDSVDPRVNYTESDSDSEIESNMSTIGRKYAEKIVSNLPLLFLIPGKQVYMKDFSEDSKYSVIQSLITGEYNDNTISSYGRYYTFEFDYNSYYEYVNAMARALAMYMHLGQESVTINGVTNKLAYFDWRDATCDAFKTYFSSAENLIFYLDGLNEVSETFGNSTTESSIASSVNGVSDKMREIQFLMGSSKLVSGVNSAVTEAETTVGNIARMTSAQGGDTLGVFGDILANHGISTILQGGKIVFPEIWQDSSYDKSYSLNIKLRSPDHDSLSIYLNILIPYILLLCLTLPRGVIIDNVSDPNSYNSPFLVKAFCKGMFNIDMGIITSLSATKGAECQWNRDGLPTQVDISLEIKDLYSNMFMTGFNESTATIIKNTAMMDFLANMAGLNLAEPEYGRKVKMYAYLAWGKYNDYWPRVFGGVKQKITNFMYDVYRNTMLGG